MLKNKLQKLNRLNLRPEMCHIFQTPLEILLFPDKADGKQCAILTDSKCTRKGSIRVHCAALGGCHIRSPQSKGEDEDHANFLGFDFLTFL